MKWVLMCFIAAGLAFIPATIAQRKGRDFMTWYIYGFFLWLVAVIHAACLQDNGDYIVASNMYSKDLTQENSNRTDLNAKVELQAWKILEDSNTHNMYLNLRFQNLKGGKVAGLKLKVEGFNSFGDKILVDGKDSFEIVLQDLDAEVGEIFRNNHPILLPDKDIRQVNIEITQVLFSDGTIDNSVPYYVDTTTTPLSQEELVRFRKKFPRATCVPEKKEDYWICTCNSVNRNTDEQCASCWANRDDLFAFAENREVEDTQVDNKKHSVNKRKPVIFITIGLLACIAIAIIIPNYIDYRNAKIAQEEQAKKEAELFFGEEHYDEAVRYLNNGEYEKAIDLFEQMGDYKDSYFLKYLANERMLEEQ